MSKRPSNNSIRGSSTSSYMDGNMDLFDSIDESVDRPREVRSKRSMIVKCPLCLDDFASTEIEQHASLCLELNELITNPRNLAKGSTCK